MNKQRVVAVSGGFDPLHIGHIRLLEEAKKLGDHLVVILNNDNWLEKKKGYVFMPEQEREAVLRALKYVDDVVLTSHGKNQEDVSVCQALEKLRPEVFANGGDRRADNIPEYDLCQRLGIEMAFNVGGEKAQSSSDLVRKAREIKL